MSRKFDLQIERWARKAGVDIRLATRAVSLRLFNSIVLRTPVDTGRARASWNIVSGTEADLSTAPADYSQGEQGGTEKALGKGRALQASNAYTISNNLEYIEPLENGHSQQAPTGMARVSVAQVRAELRTGFSGI